jgi:hypothetical protein
MSEHDPSRFDRLRIPAALALALVAFAGSKPGSAETTPAVAHETEIAATNPIIERTDDKLIALTKRMKLLHQRHKPNIDITPITRSGAKFDWMVANQKVKEKNGHIHYDRFVTFGVHGEDLPIYGIYLTGTKSPHFKFEQDYKSAIFVTIHNPNTPQESYGVDVSVVGADGKLHNAAFPVNSTYPKKGTAAYSRINRVMTDFTAGATQYVNQPYYEEK